MSDTREIRQRCDSCDRIIMWNVVNMCEEFRSDAISNNENEENEEIVNAVEDISAENSESAVRSSRRQRRGEIMVKGGVTKKKKRTNKEGFSVICNGFSPSSNGKIEQVIRGKMHGD